MTVSAWHVRNEIKKINVLVNSSVGAGVVGAERSKL